MAEHILLEREFATNASPLKDEPTTKPSYDALSEKEQEAYRALYQAAWLHRDSVTVDGLSADEVWDIYTRMRYDSPEIFELEFGVTTNSTTISTMAENTIVTVDYSYLADHSETDIMRAEMAEQVNSAAALVDEVVGDQAKAAVLHDWLCEKVVYDKEDADPMVHASYGALCQGKAVCEGYALAYDLICDKAGLPARVVVGCMDYISDPGLAHAWNIVSSNGEDFYVDTTFDDGWPVSKQYFWRDKAFMDRNGYIPYENNVFPEEA